MEDIITLIIGIMLMVCFFIDSSEHDVNVRATAMKRTSQA